MLKSKTRSIVRCLFLSIYPLSCFPQGGNDYTPSPVGEGWEGGSVFMTYFKIYTEISPFICGWET
jgi:hypothetical protein